MNNKDNITTTNIVVIKTITKHTINIFFNKDTDNNCDNNN